MVEIRQLGLTGYLDGLHAQDVAATEVRMRRTTGVLLVTRHPPTVTLGRRAAMADLHVDRETRLALGISLFHVDRGGGATFHYPDQAVIYPILDLERLGLSVNGLLDRIGAAVLLMLSAHGIRAGWDQERPGAWLSPGQPMAGAKLAAVGLHLSAGITTHGLAINTGPGGEAFLFIDPCRTPGLAVAAMSDVTGIVPDPDAVGLAVARDIAASLGSRGGGTS